MARKYKLDVKQVAVLVGEVKTAKETLEGALGDLNTEVASAYAEVEKAVNEYNRIVGEANDKKNEAVGSFNEKLSSLESFINSEHEDFALAYEDATEKWQKSERGEAVRDWISSIKKAAREIAAIEVEDVEEITVGDCGEYSELEIDLDPIEELADSP